MAKQQDGINVNAKAAGDLSDYQYYFVEQDSTNEQVSRCNAATDQALGILQNKPASSGRAALVRVLGHSKVVAGETLTAGNLVGPNARGSATALTPGSDTTAYVAGVVVVGADSGENAEMVLLGGPARAA
jgi:hypothetical protein